MMKQNNQNKPLDVNPYINQANVDSTANLNGGVSGNPYMNDPMADNPMASNNGAFSTQHFLMGALVGVAGAYLMTNEKAQKAIFKTVAKGGEMFSAGLEEMKERFEDAKAELEAQKEQ